MLPQYSYCSSWPASFYDAKVHEETTATTTMTMTTDVSGTTLRNKAQY